MLSKTGWRGWYIRRIGLNVPFGAGSQFEPTPSPGGSLRRLMVIDPFFGGDQTRSPVTD